MSGAQRVFEGSAGESRVEKTRAAGIDSAGLRLWDRQGAVGDVVAFVAFGDHVSCVRLGDEEIRSRVPLQRSPEGKGEAESGPRRQRGNIQRQRIRKRRIVEWFGSRCRGQFSASATGPNQAFFLAGQCQL